MVTALHSESCRSSVTILPWNDPKRRSPLPEHGSYVLDQLLRLFVRRKMAAVLMFRLEHDVSEGAEPSAIPQPPVSIHAQLRSRLVLDTHVPGTWLSSFGNFAKPSGMDVHFTPAIANRVNLVVISL